MNFVFNFTLLLFLSLFSFFVAQKCENLATFKDYLLEYANSKFNNQRFKHLHKILLDGNLKSEASILGKGKYGSVYSTHKLIDNKWEPVALKIMIINRESIGMFLTEVEILCSFVGNPFILQIIDFGIVNMNSLNTLAIVTEKATGDGHSLLKSERIGPQNRQEIAKSAIFAIESLHQAYFVHRDIKLENFLYFKKNEKITLKLADFGLASKSHMVLGWCGTPGYIAPEIELQKKKGICYIDGKPSDIFSLSIVIRKILMCTFPIIPKMENLDPRIRPKIDEVKDYFEAFENFQPLFTQNKVFSVSSVEKNDLSLQEKIFIIQKVIFKIENLHAANYVYGKLYWQNVFIYKDDRGKVFVRLNNWTVGQPPSRNNYPEYGLLISIYKTEFCAEKLLPTKDDDIYCLKLMIASLLETNIFLDRKISSLKDLHDVVSDFAKTENLETINIVFKSGSSKK